MKCKVYWQERRWCSGYIDATEPKQATSEVQACGESVLSVVTKTDFQFEPETVISYNVEE